MQIGPNNLTEAIESGVVTGILMARGDFIGVLLVVWLAWAAEGYVRLVLGEMAPLRKSP